LTVNLTSVRIVVFEGNKRIELTTGVLTGLVWLRTRTNGFFLLKREETFEFLKVLGRSSKAKRQVASKVGLYFKELKILP
jgi:hypothetical protein